MFEAEVLQPVTEGVCEELGSQLEPLLGLGLLGLTSEDAGVLELDAAAELDTGLVAFEEVQGLPVGRQTRLKALFFVLELLMGEGPGEKSAELGHSLPRGLTIDGLLPLGLLLLGPLARTA